MYIVCNNKVAILYYKLTINTSWGYGNSILTEVGDLFTCGDREYGKLGHDLWSLNKVDTTEKIVQVACGANHTVALNGNYNTIQ
jgi:alpha-tubulin suppressor-like RCC1 family protein